MLNSIKMDEVLDISKFMEMLVGRKISLEDLVDRALSNLYLLESKFFASHLINIRNDIRVIIAFVKVLYDYGQQMALARMYLMHKIKLLEVRENDLHAEISVLRDESATKKEGLTLQDETVSEANNDDRRLENNELNIIMDTRMIRDIDASRDALQRIRQLISNKKQEISDIERSMDGMSGSLLLLSPCVALQISIPAFESQSSSYMLQG